MEGCYVDGDPELLEFSGHTAKAFPITAHEDFDQTTAASLNQTIAVVKRGLCPFHEKAKRCEKAGAIAMIVVNTEDKPCSMGDLGHEASDIGIHVISVPSFAYNNPYHLNLPE